jgi:hypothetical protein
MSKRDIVTITMTKDRGCIVTRGPIPDKPPLRTVIRLPAELLHDLRAEAKRRGVSADEFAAAILRTVSGERLYDAVLGRPGEVVHKRLPRRT